MSSQDRCFYSAGAGASFDAERTGDEEKDSTPRGDTGSLMRLPPSFCSDINTKTQCRVLKLVDLFGLLTTTSHFPLITPTYKFTIVVISHKCLPPPPPPVISTADCCQRSFSLLSQQINAVRHQWFLCCSLLHPRTPPPSATSKSTMKLVTLAPFGQSTIYNFF